MTANETLLKLIELTNKNLEILGMINESFFTKKEHLTTVINDTRYTIPSYIALENKVNHLQAAFNNLVHAPMTGEAYMHFDGNSRVIQMRGFQQGPPTVNLDEQTSLNVPNPQFFTEDTHLFKDMLSPKPYIKLDLSELDDDITKVVVKKIIPYNRDLINTIYSKNFSILAMDYSIMQAFLTSGNLYKRGVDYDEYDVVYDLPIRRLTCSGEYIVDDVISDEVDDDMNNIIVVQLDENTPAVCTVYDGYTTRNLRKGDILTTWDGSARMVIEDIQQFMHKLTLRVLSGEYLNILPNSKSADDKISDYSRLRFYRPEDFDSDKYLNLPLEEDQYVYVTIAPLNTRMNTQAQWGTGLYINVDGLETTIINSEGNEEKVSFREYYKDNVKNIGDTINELASLLPPPLTNLSPAEFSALREAKPSLTDNDDVIDTLQVVQINKHLNEAENIKTIRNLYAQKQQYKVDLTECQNKITTLTSELSEISFDDMSGSRTMLTAQISDLKAKQNELVASINTAIDAIAQAANDSEVPIENSKFRIRGFVDINRFLQNNSLESFKDNIRAVKVRYRYKNPGIAELANVSTIGGFLFTEWNNYSAGTRHKTASYNNGHYNTKFDDPDMSTNDIKYNQVDIPINQGEQVDIQAKIVWDYGYPFVSIESDWSDIVTVKFPQELAADVQITTIIEENNNDIETNRFEKILDNHGITQHANDYIDDQNIRYFHKPESISSGFYTEERRVIPLSDKLRTLNTQLIAVQDMLLGSFSEALQVSFNVNNIEYVLKPDIPNLIHLTAFNAVPIVSDAEVQGDTIKMAAESAATTFGTISIKNVTDHTVRLFSMVPGSRNLGITESRRFQKTLNKEFDYAEPVDFEWTTPVPVDMPTSSIGHTLEVITPDDDTPSDDSTENDTSLGNNTGEDSDAGDGGRSDSGDEEEEQEDNVQIEPSELSFSANAGGAEKTASITIKASNQTQSFDITTDTMGSKYGGSYITVEPTSIAPETTGNMDKTITVTFHPAKYEYTITDHIYLTPKTNKKYITDLLLFGRDDGNAMGKHKQQLIQEGWEMIDVNLNSGQGSSGDNIYLFYKTSESKNNSGTPITNIIFTRRSRTFNTYVNTYVPNSAFIWSTDKRKYQLVTIDPQSDNSFKDSGGDLNNNGKCNNNPQYIHMYYTREYGNDTKVVDTITISTGSNGTGAVGSTGRPDIPQDINEGCGGDYIYMWITKVDLDFKVRTIPVNCETIGVASGGGGSTTTNYYIISLSEYVNYKGGRMVYILDPGNLDLLNGVQQENLGTLLTEQRCNLWATFRIKEPYANSQLGDQTTLDENVFDENGDVIKTNKIPKGVGTLELQQNLLDVVASKGVPDHSFVYATPALSNPEDMCIQSDAIQSVMELGPGEVISIPIFISYFMTPEDPNCAYTLGFDVRNSLYNDPLFYQVTLAARYNQTYSDLLQSQKASVSNQTNYNPVIRS